MRKLKRFGIILLIFLFLSVSAVQGFAGNRSEELPNPSHEGYVYDEVGFIGNETKEHIIMTAKELEEKTGAQIVVAVVKNLNGLPIEDYAVSLFEKWEIGSKEEDNGILLLISEEDKKFRIEVGYGLEGPIPDSRANQMLSILTEYFQAGEYDRGIREVYDRILAYVAEEYNVKITGAPDPEMYRNEEDDEISLRTIIFLIILIIIISRFFSGGSSGGFRGGRRRRRTVYFPGTFRGGGFGGGFSGGGGGWSGGGGRSGGGGASGGW